MLEALRCRYCSGFINPRTYTCEYCGTVYMKPKSSFELPPRELVVVREAPLITYSSRLAVDRWNVMDIPEEELRKIVSNNLVENFENAIAENMNIEAENDIIRGQIIYRARLRVVKPNFKWGT